MKEYTYKTKKLYGYMTCVTLMFAMITTNPAKSNENKNEIDCKVPDVQAYSASNFKKKASGVNAVRVYYVDNQPVTVDTSQQGWAVDILMQTD